MSRATFKPGDQVSHRGRIWVVQYQDGGLVKIINSDRQTAVVHLNQVRLQESES